MAIKGSYQVRKAAGMYWITDTQQSGIDYKQPLCVNETGAWLWQLIQKGISESEIISQYAKRFDISPEIAEQDCRGIIDIMMNY